MEIVSDIPIVGIGILNDVVHKANAIMQGNVTPLLDFDNLPANIKKKWKNGHNC